MTVMLTRGTRSHARTYAQLPASWVVSGHYKFGFMKSETRSYKRGQKRDGDGDNNNDDNGKLIAGSGWSDKSGVQIIGNHSRSEPVIRGQIGIREDDLQIFINEPNQIEWQLTEFVVLTLLATGWRLSFDRIMTRSWFCKTDRRTAVVIKKKMTSIKYLMREARFKGLLFY